MLAYIVSIKVISPDVSFCLAETNVAVPTFRLSNMDILSEAPSLKGRNESFLKNFDERIRTTYGYVHRWVSYAPYLKKDDGSTSESLAIRAFQSVTKTVRPEFLVHGTTTSARYTSTQSSALASALGYELPAAEVKAGCGTGLVATQMALNYLSQGYSSGVVVASETLSRVQDPQNVGSWLGLADAAAALLITKNPTDAGTRFKCERSLHYTDGSGFETMITRGLLPLNPGHVVGNEFILSGDQDAFLELAKKHYQKLVTTILPTANDRASIQWVLTHQVNRSIIQDCLNSTGVSGEVFWINDEYGNIGSVSVLACLHEAIKKNIFRKGDRILLMTVGGGLNCVAMVWTVE